MIEFVRVMQVGDCTYVIANLGFVEGVEYSMKGMLG